ncbi:MAG: hypothetical protein ACOX0K_01140 [Oscillospiraceae bacterium]
MLSQIEKAMDSGAITDRQLEQINRYTRRAFQKEEVFVFSLILCDNQIDRDGERFPRASLNVLAKLFLGKTGIFDHSPISQNQSARIFDTQVEELPGQVEGEPRCQLRAWAYMVRSDKSKDLILEIDAGIKKEVSVGCAVAKITCSICGADWKKEPCAHQKGMRYADKLCHHRLEEPTDAYEWSFVAVPAQQNAGVTKQACRYMDLEKLWQSREGVSLTPQDLKELKTQYKALEEKAKAGEQYLARLKGEVVKLLAVTRPEISPALAGEIAARLELSQLDELQKSLTRAAAGKFPPMPQLCSLSDTKGDESENPFVI